MRYGANVGAPYFKQGKPEEKKPVVKVDAPVEKVATNKPLPDALVFAKPEEKK